MTHDEMTELRNDLLRGRPPYERDEMGNLKRDGGTPGLTELQKLGDASPHAASLRMTLEVQLKLLDHELAKTRKER